MRWGERYVSRLGHGSRSFSMRPFEFGRMHDHRSSWKLTVNIVWNDMRATCTAARGSHILRAYPPHSQYA